MNFRPDIVRNLHPNGKRGLNDLIAYTGMSGIRMVEFGAYAGEGTRIFAENPNVSEIWAISTYKPWDDNRCSISKSNFPAAEEELDQLISEYPGKIHKFKGTLEEFHASEHDFSPDLIYIDERIDVINCTVSTAMDMNPRFIAGHDYRVKPFYEVAKCVNGMLGGPDKVFCDTSWIKDARNIPDDDIALCVVGRRENKYAREFVEHHRKLGFSHIYVYDNNMPDEEYFEDVLQDYIDERYVTVIDYRGGTSVQADVYNDCLLRYHRKHTWIAFFDFDELLCIDADKTLHELLKEYRTFDVIAVSWKVYGDSGLIRYDDRPMIERFTEEVQLADIGFTHNFKNGADDIHTKPIVRCNIPDLMFDIEQIHCPWSHSSPSLRVCNGNGELSPVMSAYSVRPVPDVIPKAYGTMHIKHFTTRTLEEWLDRKSRVGGVTAGTAKYKDYFYSINKRTIEKDLFLFKWIEDHPDDQYAKDMIADCRIWVSYHEDYLVWKYGLKEDRNHVLFPTHRDAELDNVNFMNKVWSEIVTLWYVYKNKLKSKYVGFSHYRRQIHPSRPPSPGECAIYESSNCGNVYEQYKGHNIYDMDLALEYMDEKYGKDNKYSNYIREGSILIQRNVFLLCWDDFVAMCDFLFPILEYVSDKSGCGMDPELWVERTVDHFRTPNMDTIIYQTRAIGFLAERLTSAYITVHFKTYR